MLPTPVQTRHEQLKNQIHYLMQRFGMSETQARTVALLVWGAAR